MLFQNKSCVILAQTIASKSHLGRENGIKGEVYRRNGWFIQKTIQRHLY
jgi:hypothetical protein